MAEAGPSPQQIEFLKKLAEGLLVEFDASSLHELLKHSDQSQAYEIMKKINMEYTVNTPIIQNIDRKKSIEAVTGFIHFSGSALHGPDNMQGEIRERGAVLSCYDCVFKDALPEICVFMTHVAAEVACQIIDPELEVLWTHHLTAGDPFCFCAIKKKTTPYKDPDSLGKVITKMSRINQTEEQLAQYKNFALAGLWHGLTTTFKTIHGSEKTVEVLGENAKRIGKNFGSSLIEANMLPARDIAVMGSLINQFGEGYTMQGSITSMAPGVFAKEITDCPFKNALPEICKQWEAFFNGMLEKLNPELGFHYDRMMTVGDKTCKWVLTKRQ